MKISVVLYLYGKTAIALIVPCQDMVIRIINDEKLAGLKFGKSANISFGRIMFGEFIQNYKYVQVLDWFLQMVNKVWQK